MLEVHIILLNLSLQYDHNNSNPRNSTKNPNVNTVNIWVISEEINKKVKACISYINRFRFRFRFQGNCYEHQEETHPQKRLFSIRDWLIIPLFHSPLVPSGLVRRGRRAHIFFLLADSPINLPI